MQMCGCELTVDVNVMCMCTHAVLARTSFQARDLILKYAEQESHMTRRSRPGVEASTPIPQGADALAPVS